MKNLYCLILALLLAGSLPAERIYVLFDGTCGDRITYTQTTAGRQPADYFVYHFAYDGGDHLLLETGNEGGTTEDFLPQQYLYCDSPALNPELAARVNDPANQVFMLLPTADNRYLVQPVQRASLLQKRGDSFRYLSQFSDFNFNTVNGIIGENLTVKGRSEKTYFEGRETSPCGGIYLFRQVQAQGTYPVIDYKIAPEIGLAERHLGQDGLAANGVTIRARLVNDEPFLTYLQRSCQPDLAAAPSAYATQPTASVNPLTAYTPPAPATSVAPAPVSSATYANPEVPPTVSTISHRVQKGETLYGIARQYGTTVDALKASNGLTANTVFADQRLMVTTTQAPARTGVVRNEVALAPTVPTRPYNPGNVAASNPGAAQPTPYSSVTQARGTAVYGEEIHTVQPGETVASLALKYGYTTAKFREMNNLGPNDVVRIGERLKTSDCDCPVDPAPAVDPASAPAAYDRVAPAQPQAYGQSAPAQPQAYGQSAPTQQPRGYRAPANYASPAPVPAATTTRQPQRPEFTNEPNFGQVVPDAAAPPTQTMGQLESRTVRPANTPVRDPSTYGAYPAPVPNSAPAAAPSTYNAPRPVANPYGGTPVGATAPQPPAAPANRAFHLVQEGESLYSIARRYGLTTDELRRLNELDAGSVIVPFQKLYVQ